MPLKSERELLQDRINQRKNFQSIKKQVLCDTESLIKKTELVEVLSSVTPKSAKGQLERAMKRIQDGTANTGTVGFSEKDGLEYCDPSKFYNDEAVRRHGNDPNNRLDECGFPEDRIDREFLLNHNFEELKEALEIVKYKWLYLFGDPGRGKTTFATRIVWELIKDKPTERATFLSVAKWTNSLRVGKEDYLPLDKFRRIVVVDDFDKFDHKKEFQVRNLLMLIEELKNRHLVIITSNYSRDEMLNLNPTNLDLKVMLDRVAGKSIDFPRLTGNSFRR